MNEQNLFYKKCAEIIQKENIVILFICINNNFTGAKILTDINGKILQSEIPALKTDELLILPEICPETRAKTFQTQIIKLSVNNELYEFYVEYFYPRNRLIIFGAGHVGDKLAQLSTLFDFKTIVIDDRPDLLEKFKDYGVETINTDFNNIQIKISATDFLVIVTRGHSYDKEVLEQVISSPAKYIGMIGSKKRIAAVKQLLMEAGVSAEKLKRVYSPIGLPISSNDVAEIALAILAEIIAVKNNKTEILNLSSKMLK